MRPASVVNVANTLVLEVEFIKVLDVELYLI